MDDNEVTIDLGEVVEDAVVVDAHLVAYALRLPGQARPMVVTSEGLRAAIGVPADVELPERGRTLVYSDQSPFGAPHTWERVPGGLTVAQMVDANLGVRT